MKKLIFYCLILLMIVFSSGGCMNTTTPADRKTQKLYQMRETVEREYQRKTNMIEIISKDGSKIQIEVFVNSKGEFVIPSENIKTSYQLKYEKEE